MQLRKSCSICLLLCLGLTAASVAQTIDFTPPVNPGTTINITGTTSTVSVFTVDSKDAKCDATDITTMTKNELALKSAGGAPDTFQFAFDAAHPQPLTLVKAIDAGTALCLVAFVDSTKPFYSPQPAVVGGLPSPKPNISVDPANPPTTLSQSLSVEGSTAYLVTVYAFDADYKPVSATVDDNGNKLCTFGDLGRRQAILASDVVLTSSNAQSITLNAPLSTGQQLCLVQHAADGAPEYSYFATAQNPKPTTLPSFTQPPVGNTNTVLIRAIPGSSISIYQFDAGYPPMNIRNCQEDVSNDAASQPTAKFQILAIDATSGSGTSNTVTLPAPDAAGNSSLTLADPLVPGWQLCVEQIPAAPAATTPPTAPSAPVYSGFVTVTDPNALPRGRAYYTAGVMVTNENGSNGSSSTAEYIDLGFLFAGRNENPFIQRQKCAAQQKCAPLHRWGFDTFVDGLFSQLPVAASSSSSSSSSSSGTLNILSTQESARVQGGFLFPIPVWAPSTDSGYSYFLAPLGRVAFETLLNPSATSPTGTSGSSTPSTPATFASVYGDYAAGVRIGLRKYSTDPDSAPQTLFQGDITMGKYSNLQSFVCGPMTATTTPIMTGQTSTSTSCSTAVTTGTPPTTTYNIFAQNRRVLPRLEFEGFLHFPNSPFVLGLDANLPQSLGSPSNLDIKNKPGGNVSIFFGVSGNLLTLFKSLSLAGAGQ